MSLVLSAFYRVLRKGASQIEALAAPSVSAKEAQRSFVHSNSAKGQYYESFLVAQVFESVGPCL